jgi:hypothetical protein
MSKTWYIGVQILFSGLWYLMSTKTKGLGKNQALWRLSSLEWASTYIAFTYFFLGLLSAFKSTIIKQKLKVSLYLLTVSLLGISLIVSVLLRVNKGTEEFEEYTVDFSDVFLDFMTKGGLFGLSLIEFRYVGEFEIPNWTVLIIFEFYMTAWYCFIQYMCKQATGSYSYQVLNYLSIEEIAIACVIMTSVSLGIKYVIISFKPPAKPQKTSKKE